MKNCKTCNKEFITYPSKIKLGRGKYCSRECCEHTLIKKGQRLGGGTEFKKGQMPHNYKGYRFQQARVNGKRYKLIYKPDHPNCTKSGHIREHRLVMEEHLERFLKRDEVVHHKNHDTLDNRLENLEVLDRIEHMRLHTKDNIHLRWQKPLALPHES